MCSDKQLLQYIKLSSICQQLFLIKLEAKLLIPCDNVNYYTV